MYRIRDLMRMSDDELKATAKAEGVSLKKSATRGEVIAAILDLDLERIGGLPSSLYDVFEKPDVPAFAPKDPSAFASFDDAYESVQAVLKACNEVDRQHSEMRDAYAEAASVYVAVLKRLEYLRGETQGRARSLQRCAGKCGDVRQLVKVWLNKADEYFHGDGPGAGDMGDAGDTGDAGDAGDTGDAASKFVAIEVGGFVVWMMPEVRESLVEGVSRERLTEIAKAWADKSSPVEVEDARDPDQIPDDDSMTVPIVLDSLLKKFGGADVLVEDLRAG